MYQAHFGLRDLPFGLTPDTRYFFAGPSHQEALNTLLVALRAGEGFLKITGEIGLGKTLLCRQLLKALQEGFVTAYVPNPAITPRALYLAIAEELGVRSESSNTRASQEVLLKAINQKLIANAARGLRTVLIVDEAQALSDETLEAIRLLTNLETETYKLLQVVLFGQPELDERLHQDHLRQLRQRVTFSHRLRPLTRDEFGAYVRHRLKVAGATDTDLFPDVALQLLYRASGGTPRLVNILCHKALLAAFGPGRSRVEREQALAAVQDSENNALPPAFRLWFYAQENLGLLCLALLASVAIAYLGNAL